MMIPPFALVSDLHANLEATKAVLADIDRRGVRTIACLGDIVGYGPDPALVIDAVRRHCGVAVAGNHDWAVRHGDLQFLFNFVASAAVDHTRDVLEPRSDGASPEALARWRYLGTLPTVAVQGSLSFVHGSLRNPLMEYCFGDRHTMWDPAQLEALFPRVLWICFAGHTHFPVVIRDNRTCWYPTGAESVCSLKRGRKYIINAGSVGQPRDGDPRACYAVFEGDAVRYVRVAYDVELTRRKILSMPALADRLGDRLLRGR
jgi:predicted phosphodiesterase